MESGKLSLVVIAQQTDEELSWPRRSLLSVDRVSCANNHSCKDLRALRARSNYSVASTLAPCPAFVYHRAKAVGERMASRLLQSMDYAGGDVILPQTIGRSLAMRPEEGRRGRDRHYHDGRDFWADVLNEKLGAERNVTLERARLFEWFPRNPGLFHTPQAKMARAEAERHIRHIEERAYDAFRNEADAPPDHAGLIRSVTAGEGPTRTQIFTPQGKLSMLQGGIGCIRLQPAIFDGQSRGWFMAATSSHAPDEGVPLFVPDELYQGWIDRVRDRGFATVTLHGRTRFIPRQFIDLHAVRNGIPRLYVEVDEICDAGPDEGYGLVSVASSFVAEHEGRTKIYAAYVTFDPGHAGARSSAARWLRDEYVRGFYDGELLTDFDQQAPTISDTLFSLDEVLTSPDLAAAIRRLRDLRGYFDWEMLKESTFSFIEHKEYVRMKVEANNNNGNMVVGGDGSNNRLLINNPDLPGMAASLQELISGLRTEPPSDDRDRAIGALLDAKEAADAGDGNALSSALKRMKPLASKVIDIGEKIGVGVAVAAIKSATGI